MKCTTDKTFLIIVASIFSSSLLIFWHLSVYSVWNSCRIFDVLSAIAIPTRLVTRVEISLYLQPELLPSSKTRRCFPDVLTLFAQLFELIQVGRANSSDNEMPRRGGEIASDGGSLLRYIIAPETNQFNSAPSDVSLLLRRPSLAGSKALMERMTCRSKKNGSRELSLIR